MFAPSRDQARRFFIDTWAKYRIGAKPCPGWSTLCSKCSCSILNIMRSWSTPERYVERDYLPEAGAFNRSCTCHCTWQWRNNCR